LNPQDLLPETQPPNPHQSKTRTVWIVLFWSLPFVLALGQAMVMWRLVDRIAYEEMSESVRNPYWLAHRTLYDRGSTNVSWYAFILGLFAPAASVGYFAIAEKISKAAFGLLNPVREALDVPQRLDQRLCLGNGLFHEYVSERFADPPAWAKQVKAGPTGVIETVKTIPSGRAGQGFWVKRD